MDYPFWLIRRLSLLNQTSWNFSWKRQWVSDNTLFEKDGELAKLHEKVKDLGCIVIFLEENCDYWMCYELGTIVVTIDNILVYYWVSFETQGLKLFFVRPFLLAKLLLMMGIGCESPKLYCPTWFRAWGMSIHIFCYSKDCIWYCINCSNMPYRYRHAFLLWWPF